MINLLGTKAKEDIRAARLNVLLRKYALLILIAVLGILAVYGVGFYFLTSQKQLADEQASENEVAVNQFATVQSEAKAYKNNLSIAKKVLSSGLSYSTFLTETASALPAGSILNDLTLTDLGSAPVSGTVVPPLTLHARTNSYGGALLIKENLENSDLFENVSIVNITQTITGPESTPIEKKYPFVVTISAAISKPKVTQ